MNTSFEDLTILIVLLERFGFIDVLRDMKSQGELEPHEADMLDRHGIV